MKQSSFILSLNLARKLSLQVKYRSSKIMQYTGTVRTSFFTYPPYQTSTATIFQHLVPGRVITIFWLVKSPDNYISHQFTLFSLNWRKCYRNMLTLDPPLLILVAETGYHHVLQKHNECGAFETRHRFFQNICTNPSIDLGKSVGICDKILDLQKFAILSEKIYRPKISGITCPLDAAHPLSPPFKVAYSPSLGISQLPSSKAQPFSFGTMYSQMDSLSSIFTFLFKSTSFSSIWLSCFRSSSLQGVTPFN